MCQPYKPSVAIASIPGTPAPPTSTRTSMLHPATDALMRRSHLLHKHRSAAVKLPMSRCISLESCDSDSSSSSDASHDRSAARPNMMDPSHKPPRGLVRSMAFSSGLCNLLLEDYTSSLAACLPATTIMPIDIDASTPQGDRSGATTSMTTSVHTYPATPTNPLKPTLITPHLPAGGLPMTNRH